MMRLKLLAYLLLFAAPLFIAAETQSLRAQHAQFHATQMRDLEYSRRLAEMQSQPDYVPPAEPIIVSMLR